MYGVIDLNKSHEEGSEQFICFIAHPMKCGGTTLMTELRKHKELRVINLIPECDHYTPAEIFNMIPKFWGPWKHLPIYCITRHPYERFKSQLSFIPIIMLYGKRPERFFEKTPHQLSGSTLFCPQWKYMSWKGKRLENLKQIKLEDVTGTTIDIEGFKVDMSNHLNTKEWASDQVNHKLSDADTLSKLIFGEHTKEYIHKSYPNDFENIGYYK